ncbi:hypothetical protein [Isobaculum melis]|uniref:GyrI-like small molecule binding domain-containing protein n=1 Tax=Isobaculum melis TaxID=142588 RepID=A0A1H9R6C2_9LACT|nr:hypothetical protein [Isobaculum melis]SER67493.1 hypothetical protein SAMN04488559_10345 [Isobaculum melis]
MIKVTIQKKYAPIYTAKKGQLSLIDVPAFTMMELPCAGNQAGTVFEAKKLNALYDVAKGIRLFMQQHYEQDYLVFPISCEKGTAVDLQSLFEEKTEVQWKLRMLLPEELTSEDFQSLKDQVQDKVKNREIEAIDFVTIAPHQVIQGLYHQGNEAEEEALADAMKQFAAHEQLQVEAAQSIIYLEDLRKLKENAEVLMRIPLKNSF